MRTHPSRRIALLFLTAFMAAPLAAQASAEQVMQQIEQYQWTKRVLVVFAPTAGDADYQRQRAALTGQDAMLDARDLVRWDVLADGTVRHNGALRPQLHARDFYEAFGVDAAGFTAILIGKDGEEKLHQTTPISAEKLRRVIDAMPMRRREMVL